MTDKQTQTEESPQTTQIQVNFRNGGFAEFDKIIGYQINAGVLSVLQNDSTAVLYPIDTIQNISITQE
jgi:hypothetical protein